MPLVRVCAGGRGGGRCVCKRTCSSWDWLLSESKQGCWTHEGHKHQLLCSNISSSALKQLQSTVLAWTLLSIHGLDPTRGNHCSLCMGRWTLRWSFMLWASEPCRRSEPVNHTAFFCEESNLLSSVLEETTRRSEGLNSTAKNIPPELDARRKASRFRQMRVSKGSILFFSSQKVVF